jgi:hypothetical protein
MDSVTIKTYRGHLKAQISKVSVSARLSSGSTIAVLSVIQGKGRYTLLTLLRIVTQYRDSVDETRDRVTYHKLVTR